MYCYVFFTISLAGIISIFGVLGDPTPFFIGVILAAVVITRITACIYITNEIITARRCFFLLLSVSLVSGIVLAIRFYDKLETVILFSILAFLDGFIIVCFSWRMVEQNTDKLQVDDYVLGAILLTGNHLKNLVK